MFLPRLRFLLAGLLCCSLGACVSLPLPNWAKRKPVPKAVPIHFPKTNQSNGSKEKPKLVGNVLLVNADANFVIIDAHGWSLPDAGTALKCLREGVETGIVAVGRERQGAHVVADIVNGAPKKGDQVFQ